MGEVGADAPPWAPGIMDIRKAHLAEATALESVVSALETRQRSSIMALRQQVEAIAAWQARVTGRYQPGRGSMVPTAIDEDTPQPLSVKENTAQPKREVVHHEEEAAPRSELLSAVQIVESEESTGSKEDVSTTASAGIKDDPTQCEGISLPHDEEVTFLMHRVGALERELTKVQGMWDMNKGQRIIEVWMSLLNRKTYKPTDCDDPVDCAVMTIQNWWRDMLVTKLRWSSSRGDSNSSSDDLDGTVPDEDPGLSSVLEASLPGTRPLQSNGHEFELPSPQAQPDAAQVGGLQASSASIDKVSLTRDASDIQRPSQESVQLNEGRHDSVTDSEDQSPEDFQPPPVGEEHLRPVATIIAAPAAVSPLSTRSPSPASSTRRRTNELGKPHEGRGIVTRVDATRVCEPNTDASRSDPESGSRPRMDEVAWPVINVEETPRDNSSVASSSHGRGRHRQTSANTQLSPRRRKRPSGISHHHAPGAGHHYMSGGGRRAGGSSHQHGVGSGSLNGGTPSSDGGTGVQGLFDGAMGGSPVLMITSIAMQLQSLETEVENIQKHLDDIDSSFCARSQENLRRQSVLEASMQHRRRPLNGVIEGAQAIGGPKGNSAIADVSDVSRRLEQLQQELESVREREQDKERTNELSLETLEALIMAKDEEFERRFRQQAEENTNNMNKLMEALGARGAQDKSDAIRGPLLELKLELRSLFSSLAAISGHETSAALLRTMEGIRHLLTSLAERARALEEEMGDPAQLARSIVADDVTARRFADMATDLGTTLFAFIKAQVLQARRAREGRLARDTKHRRSSSPEVASAVIAAKVAGRGDEAGDPGGTRGKDEEDTGCAGTHASPQAWAKLGSLVYTREQTNESLPFPSGLVVLLKAISDALNHCVGTGDLAVRLSLTLEDLTLYVAQRADKERESMVRQLGAPVDDVKTKLEEVEGTLAGFQRTMHLVLSEVEADKERSEAIKALGATVHDLQLLFSRVSGELQSKACASEIEKALDQMTSKINQSANQQSRLQRLGKQLGNDHNSSSALKRLQIELEQARSQAVLAMLPRENEVLIGSKCLSCNRPLGGFATPPQTKQSGEWFTGAGHLSGPRERVIEATTGDGIGGSAGNIAHGKAPGQTQPVMTPGKILPSASDVPPSATVGGMPTGPPRRGPQGPLLFERTGSMDSTAPKLKGRVLRGGGGSTSSEGNLSVSKYPRLVPLTAPKSAPSTEKLYSTTK